MTPISKSANFKPQIVIFNNTLEELILKLIGESCKFSAKEKRTISASVGDCAYTASALLVIPFYGAEKFVFNYEYSWEFYIIIE